MVIFWGFIVIVCFLYLILVCFIICGWIRTQPFIIQDGFIQPAVSVIIPVRNDSEGLNWLLSDLADQDYPDDKFEVIIVDDHSVNPPGKMISGIKRKINIKILNLDSNEQGKKDALLKGLNASASDVVLTTDADCRVKVSWISEMLNYLITHKAKLVFGAVLYQKPGKLNEWLQSLEFLSLVASGAGFAGNGHPILCNSANMGFERIKYLDYMKENRSSLAVSGDDILFLLWLKKNYPGQIGFIKSMNSTVETKPAGSLKEFINQRLRWTSKSRYYRDILIIVTALIVYFTSLTLTVTMAGSLFSGLMLKGFATLFLLKFIIDLVFMFIVTGYYRNRYLLIIFFPLEIIYFIYISIIGLAGNLVSFGWKGRKGKP